MLSHLLLPRALTLLLLRPISPVTSQSRLSIHPQFSATSEQCKPSLQLHLPLINFGPHCYALISPSNPMTRVRLNASYVRILMSVQQVCDTLPVVACSCFFFLLFDSILQKCYCTVSIDCVEAECVAAILSIFIGMAPKKCPPKIQKIHMDLGIALEKSEIMFDSLIWIIDGILLCPASEHLCMQSEVKIPMTSKSVVSIMDQSGMS